MAKMAKGGFSCAATEETQYLIKAPRPKVQEETKRGVDFPGHTKVKAVIERHPAMLRQNHTPRCLPCPNGTAKIPQTYWTCKGTCAPPPDQRRQQTPEPTPEATPEPTPPLPGTPPTSTGNTSGAQRLELINVAAGHAYLHTSLPCTESFTLNISAQNSKHDIDFDPDVLPDEEISTG